MKRAGGEGEIQSRAAERVPDSLPDERIRIVIFGVVVEPVLHFVVDAVVAQISDADYRRDLLGDVVGLAHGFAYDVDRFRRRVGVESVEKYEPRVQVIARTNLDRFFRGVAIGYQHNVIGERANLDGPPTDLFDHARVPLRAHSYDVAHLKRAICLQRDSREKVTQRVLQCKTENDTEDCGGGEQRAEVYFRKEKRESNQKEDREGDDGEDVSNQRGSVDSFEPESESEED